jgi:hypothetical protein
MPEKAVKNCVVLLPVKAVDTTARKAIKHESGNAKKLSMQLSEKL